MNIFLSLVAVFGICSNSFASAAVSSAHRIHALRLKPGADPRVALVAYAKEHKLKALSVLSAVGSLNKSVLRFADQKAATTLLGPREVVSLSGTISLDGPHLHLSLADATGAVVGGHLAEGSQVFTTLELVLLELSDLEFRRPLDLATGHGELEIRKRGP